MSVGGVRFAKFWPENLVKETALKLWKKSNLNLSLVLEVEDFS